MICVCSIIIVISALYYSEVNLYGFVKPYKFRGTRECTLYLALDGVYRGATKCGYKYKNIIDFVNDNLESRYKRFFFFNYVFGVRYFMQVARNSVNFVYCN
jgi:hypothetical protein